MRLFGRIRITAFQTIVLGFLGIILLGTLLLMLPFARRGEGEANFLECLFTATSATCVTGLVVRDTSTFWSPFGQAVILFLIQTGGLGVITVSVSLAFLSGRRIGLMQRSIMQESISAPQVGGIIRLTRFLILASLAVEGAGALLMLPAMIPAFGWGKGLWYALFHSVSAFCNAGFDLMGETVPFSSLTAFAWNPFMNLAVLLLITVGGIGFLVWDDLREHGFHWKLFRLQTRVVLITSFLLTLLPALLFYFLELRQLSPLERVWPALFQSVTLRTAGFNTVDLSQFSPAGHTMMIFCMLVGGSPGSTAGGMKTTTLAVLLTTAWSVSRRRDAISFPGRRVPEDVVHNAVTILMMYGILFALSGVVISQLEALPLRACLFETASALGTVGLTLGITPELSTPSRLILILLMFLGRVGGLTLIYAAQSAKKSRGMLPLEKITVG